MSADIGMVLESIRAALPAANVAMRGPPCTKALSESL